MHVVIIGGGFGGVKAALDLAKDPHMKITLISSEPYFLYHATLYSVATGHSPDESVISLGSIFAGHGNVRIIRDTITTLDTEKRVVHGKVAYDYDELILALGVVTSYFGIKGLERHSYGLKSLEQVQRFKSHMREEVLSDKRLDTNYVVIGAGPTGVELAGALSSYLTTLKRHYHLKSARARVILVEAAPRVLPHFSHTASKKVHSRLQRIGVDVMLGHTVESVDADTVRIDGQNIPSHSVIWTAGVKQNPFFEHHADIFRRRTRGFVTVNDQLEATAHVYVIGDNASTKYSGLATTALTDARFVATVLKAKRRHKRLPNYKAVRFPYSVPVDRHWAYVESHGIYAAGLLGAFARRILELQVLATILGYKGAYPVWKVRSRPALDDEI